MVARYLNNDKKAETQLRETQVTKSDTQRTTYAALGQTGTSLHRTTASTVFITDRAHARPFENLQSPYNGKTTERRLKAQDRD